MKNIKDFGTLFLSAIIFVLISKSAVAQDTTFVTLKNKYVGAVVGNDFYPAKKTGKYVTKTIVESYNYNLMSTPKDLEMKMYLMNNPKVNSVVPQPNTIVPKDKNYYLRLAGNLKNLSHVVSAAGSLTVLQQVNQSNNKEVLNTMIITSTVTYIVSLGLDVAGNHYITKAGMVE